MHTQEQCYRYMTIDMGNLILAVTGVVNMLEKMDYFYIMHQIQHLEKGMCFSLRLVHLENILGQLAVLLINGDEIIVTTKNSRYLFKMDDSLFSDMEIEYLIRNAELYFGSKIR